MYDVRDFIARHPGGRDQLLLAAGKDVSVVFESYHKPGTKTSCVLASWLSLCDAVVFYMLISVWVFYCRCAVV